MSPEGESAGIEEKRGLAGYRRQARKGSSSYVLPTSLAITHNTSVEVVPTIHGTATSSGSICRDG